MKVPVQVLVHQKTRTLELIYQNNARAVFPFEFLRVFSPSAEVQGHSPEEAVLQVGKAEVGLKGVEACGTVCSQASLMTMVHGFRCLQLGLF